MAADTVSDFFIQYNLLPWLLSLVSALIVFVIKKHGKTFVLNVLENAGDIHSAWCKLKHRISENKRLKGNEVKTEGASINQERGPHLAGAD